MLMTNMNKILVQEALQFSSYDYAASMQSKTLKAVRLWDGGSTLSLITFKFAKSLGLKEKPVKLEIIIVGGEAKAIDSELYRIILFDNENRRISIEVLGIDRISSPMSYIDISNLEKVVNSCPKDISRLTGN